MEEKLVLTSSEIGRNRFGPIVHGKFKKHVNVAVAVISIEHFSVELDVLKKTRNSQNVLHFYGLKVDGNFMYIATAMWAGSLRDVICGSYTGPPVGEAREIARQIVNGLDYLHRNCVFHGALKPSNILISYPDRSVPAMVKLANFAFVCVSKSRQSLPLWKKVLGSGSSRSWMAPEIFHSNFYTVEMDTFALGCVVGFSLSGGRHVFHAETKLTRIHSIAHKQPMTLTVKDLKNIPGAKPVFDLIAAMVNSDASRRPTISQVLEHPFFIQPTRKKENYPIPYGKLLDENRELVVEIVRIDEKSRSLSIPANLTSQTKRTSLNVPVCEMKAEEKVLKTRRSVYPKSKARSRASVVSNDTTPSNPAERRCQKLQPTKSNSRPKKSAISSSASDPKLPLQECLKALVHATLCPDENCNLKFCKTLKNLGQHMRHCQKKNGTTCRFCKEFTVICFQHAKTCTAIHCLVPSCHKIRARMVLMASGTQPLAIQAPQTESAPLIEQLRQPFEIEMSDATEAYVEASLQGKGSDNLFGPTYNLPETFGTPRQFVAYADILKWLENHPTEQFSPSISPYPLKVEECHENGDSDKEDIQRDAPDDCLRLPGFACMSTIHPTPSAYAFTEMLSQSHLNGFMRPSFTSDLPSPTQHSSMTEAPVLFDLNSRLVVDRKSSSFRSSGNDSCINPKQPLDTVCGSSSQISAAAASFNEWEVAVGSSYSIMAGNGSSPSSLLPYQGTSSSTDLELPESLFSTNSKSMRNVSDLFPGRGHLDFLKKLYFACKPLFEPKE